ncbi:MAG TPA: hypothetical protein VFA39_03075 [Steroidobacteraceae bacterium]|nr:hypothetical protein [Steroidobacteraceae bacterium]
MGINWNSGLIYWKDHTPRPSVRYSLAHLHPFIQVIELPATDRHPARSVGLHVSFGLHTFTRAVELHDGDDELYGDNREVRTFCPARYKRSLELPGIIRTLESRRCEFARGMSGGQVNYVTVEMADGTRYAAFFDVRRLKKVGPDAVHLMVQSAMCSNRVSRRRGRAESTSMPSSATRSAELLPDRLREKAPAHPQKCETPPEAGFRQSGSSYLPPGRTSCEAGVHQAGFCALGQSIPWGIA